MSKPPNDMDPAKLMDEVRSLHQKIDSMTKAIGSLKEKMIGITESQENGGETVHKSADSINIIIRFLASLRKLSPEELKNTLIEADAILNNVNSTSTDQTLERNVSKDKLKTILKEVFDLLNSLSIDTKADVNNPVASTSVEATYNNIKDNKVEEAKIQFWRKYKNKYNYLEKFRCELPPVIDPVEEVESLQNDVNAVVQNGVNPIVQNDVNPIVQNDGNAVVHNNVRAVVQNNVRPGLRQNVNAVVQNDVNPIVQNDGNAVVHNNVRAVVQNNVRPRLRKNVKAFVQNIVNAVVQNNVNAVVQNDVNPIVQNDVNPIVQNDGNVVVHNNVRAVVQNNVRPRLRKNVKAFVQNNLNAVAQNNVNAIVQNDVNAVVQNNVKPVVRKNVNAAVQNNVNAVVQNDVRPGLRKNVKTVVPNNVNASVQNNVNAVVQNDENVHATYTINDIIQNESVYELLKSRLKNSPYEDPYLKSNTRNSTLTLTLQSGMTIVKPVSHVAPLVVMKKCDDLCSVPLLNKKKPNIDVLHLPSTSNSYNTTANITKRETRFSKTKNMANSVSSNVKTRIEKRRSTIKDSKYEPSKKKKKVKKSNIQ